MPELKATALIETFCDQLAIKLREFYDECLQEGDDQSDVFMATKQVEKISVSAFESMFFELDGVDSSKFDKDQLRIAMSVLIGQKLFSVHKVNGINEALTYVKNEIIQTDTL